MNQRLKVMVTEVNPEERNLLVSRKAVQEREIEHYLARVEAERQSQKMPDDLTADAARIGVPDVRGLSADRGAADLLEIDL